MIEQLANTISGLFLSKNIIKENDLSIYTYGMEILISEFISTIIAYCIGIVTHKLFQTMLYLFVFSFIRVYTGGYHASTHRNCIILFNFLLVITILLIECFSNKAIHPLLVSNTIASAGIIFTIAPVADTHKPFNSFEKNIYKRKARTRTVLLSFTLILIYTFSSKFQTLAAYGMAAICEIAFFLTVGLIKNKWIDCNWRW